MEDENGYNIISEFLLKTDRAKENDITMAPEQIYEYADRYGDDYEGLLKGFSKEFYDFDVPDDFIEKTLNMLYEDGFIVKKKPENIQTPTTDSTLPLEGGVADSGNQNNETTGSLIKDSYFFGFDHNLPVNKQDGTWPWPDISKVYDQNRHVTFASGKYYVNGEFTDPKDLSNEDYFQAWVNAYNEMWQGIPLGEEGNYNEFNIDESTLSSVLINHPSQIIFSPQENLNIKGNADYENKPIINERIESISPYKKDNIPSYDIILGLGTGQYWSHAPASGANWLKEGISPEGRMVLYKDYKGQDVDSDEYSILNLDGTLSDFFYSSEDYNKNFKRINEIASILSEDKKKPFEDREYYEYLIKTGVDYEGNIFGGTERSETTSETHKSVLNGEGDELYQELLGYYKEIEDNILDNEAAVLLAREQFFASSYPGGNPFTDNIVLGDPLISNIFTAGMSEDSEVLQDVVELYRAHNGNNYSPVKTILKDYATKMGYEDPNDLSYLYYINTLIQNELEAKKFYDDISEVMDIREELFLDIDGARSTLHGWTHNQIEKEKELFWLLRDYETATEEDKTDLKKQIDELKGSMNWIGSEMFDIDGARINEVEFNELGENEKLRIEKFMSEYNEVYNNLEGKTDKTELLSIYHQIASEYTYLEYLKNTYKVKFDSGVEVTLGEIIENPTKFFSMASDVNAARLGLRPNMIVQIMEWFSDNPKDLTTSGLTKNDVKRIHTLMDNYNEHKETLTAQMLASGRLLFLNSDPGTITTRDRDGWGASNAFGEGFTEGFINLWPGNWETLGGENYDYQSTREVLGQIIEMADERGYILTDEQREAADMVWGTEAMYGLGSAIPLIAVISLITGPMSSSLIRTGVGATSRLITGTASKLGRTSTWINNVNKSKTFRDSYMATVASINNSGPSGQFVWKLSEEMAKGWLSFEMAGAHGEMGAGLHAGSVVFQSIFPQTKLSRWLLWDSKSPANLRPKGMSWHPGKNAWVDDAGNVMKNFKPELVNTPFKTLLPEKTLELMSVTAGGAFGMYIGEIFDYSFKNGIDLEAMGRDVLGIGIEDDEYRWLNKFTITLFLSSVFSSVHAVKTGNMCEATLTRYSKDPKVPENVRNQLTSYLDQYHRFKVESGAYQGNKYQGTDYETMLKNDELAGFYNIDIDSNGNLIPREMNVSEGYFTKDSFTYNKKKNVWEAQVPNQDIKFKVQRNTKANGAEFYINVHGKKVVLGKTKSEMIANLNNYISAAEKGVVETGDPLAGAFEYLRTYNRETINKEQSVAHNKKKFTVYNDMSGDMMGQDGYLVKIFPETKMSFTVNKKTNMQWQIAEYKKSVEDILAGNPNLHVVTYESGGKTYIEIMAGTESFTQASSLSRKYSSGTVVNLKDGKDISISITGPDINNSKHTILYNNKTKRYEFDKSGLLEIDKENPNFKKSILDRVSDVNEVTFEVEKRSAAIKEIDNIINNLDASRSGFNPTLSRKFWKIFQAELKNEEVSSMEVAWSNTLEIIKNQKFDTKFINQIETMGADRMINTIIPNNFAFDISPHLKTRDGIIQSFNELFSFNNKPEIPIKKYDGKNYDIVDGKPVLKNPKDIYNNVKEALDNMTITEKNKFWTERSWEYIGERVWDRNKVIKDGFKYTNRWLKELYTAVEKENPELAIWLKKKGNIARTMLENSATASGWAKVLSFEMRKMFSGMSRAEMELFENIALSRHVVSMDKTRDTKKVELDKDIENLNFMMEQNFPQAEIDAAFEIAQKSAKKLGLNIQDPTYTYDYMPGAYGKYSISTKDGKIVIEKSNLTEDGFLDIRGHIEVINGEAVTKAPWRLKHAETELNKELAEIFLKESKELNSGKNPEGKGGIKTMFKKYLNPSFESVNKKVDKYFDSFKVLAKQMYESGIINKDAYKTMIDREYFPREFTEWATLMKNGNNSTGGENIFDALKVLQGGLDVGPMNMDVQTLAINKTMAVSKMIWENNTRTAIADLIKANEIAAAKYGKSNFFDFGYIFDKSKVDMTGRGKELGIPEKELGNYVEIEYRINGESNYYALHKDLHNSLVKKNMWSKLPNVKNFLNVVSGSALVRASTTILEPAFMVKNFFRDGLHIMMHTDTYSIHLPTAVKQFAGDLSMIGRSAWSVNKSNNPYIQRYYKAGGSLDFLTTQSRRIGTEENPFVENTKWRNFIKDHKFLYEADRIFKNRSKNFFDALSYLGESSEMFTRLAVFERSVKNYTESFINKHGRPPSEKEVIQIDMDAANAARNTIDFNQGGTIIKAIDALIPYTNASVQGFKVFGKYVKENPGAAAYKYAQFGTYVAGLNMYNWQTHPDEMKQLWETRPYECMNNFIFFLPYKDETGQQMYMKLAKEHSTLGFSAWVEGQISQVYSGKNYTFDGDWKYHMNEENKSLFQKSVEQGVPFGGGPWELIKNIPLVKATMGYSQNWDFYKHQDIYFNKKNNVNPENEFVLPGQWNSTNQIYIDFADNIGALLGTDVSPSRLEYSMNTMGLKGTVWETLQFGYNEFFDQPNQVELQDSYNEEAINGLEIFLGPTYKNIVGFVDMTRPTSDMLREDLNIIDEAEKKRATLEAHQNEQTEYFVDEWLKIYSQKDNKYKDNPFTEVDEFLVAKNEKYNELMNYYYNQYGTVDGKSKGEVTDEFKSIVKETEILADFYSKNIGYDVRTIWNENKRDPENAALQFYLYINSASRSDRRTIKEQALKAGLFSDKRTKTKFERAYQKFEENGWESYMEDLDADEIYYLKIKEAIFNDRKWNEKWINGKAAWNRITTEQIQYIAPFHLIKDKNLSTEEYNKIAKDYMENFENEK